RTGNPCQLLVVGLYRDTEVDRDHPLVPVLAELRSVAGVERLALGRLDQAAVAELLDAVGGGPEPADLYAETSGNPLFLVQVLRHLGEGGSYRPEAGRPVPVPEGVSQLVSRRLARLPAPVVALLEIASVVGTEVTAPLLTE